MSSPRSALGIPYEDDGEAVTARIELADGRDATLFAVLDDAVRACAEVRFEREATTDGEATFFHDGNVKEGEVLVDARPGRAAGGWWYFVARVVQAGEERAHLERRLRPRPE